MYNGLRDYEKWKCSISSMFSKICAYSKFPLNKLPIMLVYRSVSEEQWQDINILIGCVKFPFLCQFP